ncbi:hypothetical protein JCM10213_007403 [Rhodosporidiobolus nylandii]
MPPFPAAPLSQASPTSQDWHGPPSEFSVRTTGSQARRAVAMAAAQEEAAARRAVFEAQEAARMAQLAQELDAADAESLAQQARPPSGTGDEADVELLVRRRNELAEEQLIINRILSKKGATVEPPPQDGVPGIDPSRPARELHQATFASYPFPLPRTTSRQPLTPPPPIDELQDATIKKLPAPKAWAGVYNRRELEDWIESAAGYLASYGVNDGFWFSKEVTPNAYYALRSLFSPDSRSGSISPLSWFTNWTRTQPVFQLFQVWSGMKDQWPDVSGDEYAYHRYRSATQGRMKVAEFGSHLQSLAADCADMLIDDSDLRDTFTFGLNPAARNYLRQVLITREAAMGYKTRLNFKDTLAVAATYDLIEADKPTAPKPSSSAPPSSSSTSRPQKQSTNAPSSSSSPSAPAQSGKTPRHEQWVEQATGWQARHPMSDKATWFQTDARTPTNPVWCFNCGVSGHHYSLACPNPRKNPQVVVAPVLPALSPVPSSSSPAEDSTTVAGNAEGEQS